MKKVNMLPIKELEPMVSQPYMCIYKVRQALHVTLHPRYWNNIELGILHYFNKQINRWHPKLNGILANYGKLKLKKPHGMILNEEAHIHLDVVSDFWVFRPDIGSILQGIVTKTSPKHVACLVHGVFNVPCYHPYNLGSNQWWGINAQVGRPVRLKVIKTDVSQKVPFILGELEKWSLDGTPVTDDTLIIDPPVQAMEHEIWEVIAAEKESWEEKPNDNSLQPLYQSPPFMKPEASLKPKSQGSKVKNVANLVTPETSLNPKYQTSKENNIASNNKQSNAEVIKRKCCFCSEVIRKKNLRSHYIFRHFKEKLLAKIPSCAYGKTGPFQCPKCEKSLMERRDILRHFANFHNGILDCCTEAQLQGLDVPDFNAPTKLIPIDETIGNTTVSIADTMTAVTESLMEEANETKSECGQQNADTKAKENCQDKLTAKFNWKSNRGDENLEKNKRDIEALKLKRKMDKKKNKEKNNSKHKEESRHILNSSPLQVKLETPAAAVNEQSTPSKKLRIEENDFSADNDKIMEKFDEINQDEVNPENNNRGVEDSKLKRKMEKMMNKKKKNSKYKEESQPTMHSNTFQFEPDTPKASLNKKSTPSKKIRIGDNGISADTTRKKSKKNKRMEQTLEDLS